MSSNFSIRTLLIIAAILQITWGLVPSASQMVIQEIPVELYVSIRWTISGCLFFLYLAITKSFRSISTRDFGFVFGLGLLGYGLASIGTLYGLKVGGVSNFALTSAIGPIVISGVSILLLRERPHRLFYIALPLCVLGLFLLVFGKYQTSSLSVAGGSALLILMGFTMEAIVFVYSKRFKTKMGIPQYLAISQLGAAFVFWCLQLFYFQQWPAIPNLTVQGWSAALFVSIVACVLCYAVLYWLLSYIPGHRLALFDGLHALSASTVGYLLFKDILSPLMIVGGVLIFCGLIVGNLKKST